MTGKIRYTFRDFPLSIHPQAPKAAEAAECAGEQGKFWQMHDLLFEQQSTWSGQSNAVDTFKGFAGKLGLNQTQFNTCIDGDKFKSQIDASVAQGTADGVSGTPAFLIEGQLLSGAQPLSTFQQTIDYYLAGGKAPTLEVPATAPNSKGNADAKVVITEFSDFQ